MGNQCTGNRFSQCVRMSCIETNNEPTKKDPNQFPGEDDIHKKIDKYVENFHRDKKHVKNKRSGHPYHRKCTKHRYITHMSGRKNCEKRMSKSVPPEHQTCSREEFETDHNTRHFPQINASNNNLSDQPKCENGMKGENPADKDSGGSSQKYPAVGLNKLKDRVVDQRQDNAINTGHNQRKVITKSKYSSSNYEDGTSNMNLSLSNLNFSALVKAYDETPKEKVKSNDFNLAIQNEEKSVRMENEEGYETPNLGMKGNPSLKNLQRNSKEIKEFESMVVSNKIIHNIHQDSGNLDAVNLIININDRPAKFVDEYIDEDSSSPAVSSVSDENLEEIIMEKVVNVQRYRNPRDSSYKELVEEYHQRSSRHSHHKNFSTGNLFRNFYRRSRQNDANKSIRGEHEDNEAIFLEGEMETNKPSPKRCIPKKSMVHGKSSVGYKPFGKRRLYNIFQ
ncbi:unnamed protein product [Moneuplotes crassus]|uniref:Uncharacterized protein n=2 Tax=Euplotes crassus TaxID=5936 RepID=A0AAD1XFC9_EUPCR|nr:unnamed protein product [Moneuplotes crassus]